MKVLRPISILTGWLMLTANATAQVSLAPPNAADKPAVTAKETAKENVKDKPKAKR